MKLKPWQREAAVFLGFVLGSILLTWPLCAHFSTQIGGDLGDHWQTLWGMWWVRKALVELHQSPFFSSYVHWPLGMPMVFETFDLPDCLLAIPLWSFLSPIAVFNVIELWSYPLAGYFFYRLVLELFAGPSFEGLAERSKRPAAVAAGALFTFAPYHFGHAVGHMHILAYEWIPLYFWMLVRALHRPERRWPVFAAVALAMVSTASWYHLLACVVLTFPYLACVAVFEPQARTFRTVRSALLLGATYLALLWPLFSAMLEAKAASAWDGAHDANTFSADLLQFFVPNDCQALGSKFHEAQHHWSGNFAENCDYLGYAVILLAILGCLRARAARIWVGIACLGALLAMGPHLHVGGQVHPDAPMLYGLVLRLAPLLEFMGVPVRLGIVATFGLSLAAAFGLAWLWGAWPGRLTAVALLALAAVEFWPHAFVTSAFPVPAIFADWAKDPTPFGVYDNSGWTRPLYNGVLHGHPMVDIYLSRTQQPLIDWLDQHPVIGRLRHPPRGPFPLSAEEGQKLLRDQGIRYFVLQQWQRDPTLERDLQLPTVFIGDGIRVYAVW